MQPLLAVGTLLLAVLVPTVPPAAAVVAMCDGRAVTITGQPGGVVQGTAGDDVVATGGAASVDASGGDDRVCVTGPSVEHVTILAGEGADRVHVLVSAPSMRVMADLGAGPDVFVSGATADDVDASGAAVDEDVDRVRTGGNDDVVEVGDAGADVGDVVDLGVGADALHVRGRPGTGHVFRGGQGRDALTPGTTPGPGRLVVDNVRQEGRLEGSVVQTWSGFETFQLTSDPGQSVAFVGGPADELVRADPFVSGPLVRALMGAGDDVLAATERRYLPEQAAPQEAPYDGGPGRDRIVVGVAQDDLALDERLLVDLLRGTVVATNGGVDDIARIRRFEDARAYGEAVTIRGQHAANTLEAYGCTVTVAGRGGDDTMAQPERFENHNGCRRGMSMWGGPGADLMVGREGADRLLGGPGRDRAVGNAGPDTCRAEVRAGCER